MSQSKINERQYLIYKEAKGKDPLVDEILANPDGPQGQLYKTVKEYHEDKLRRSYIEACLLASQDFDRISELLEMDKELIRMYHDIYYVVGKLDRLSKLELLDVKDSDEAVMKIWALSQGLDFIAWRLGKKVNISPIDGLTDLFNTCLYKSKEAIFNKNDSGASRESTKWVKLSMDIARLLKIWVMDSAGARRDIEIALREVIPEFKTIDDLDGFTLNLNINTNVDEDEEKEETD